LNLAFFRSEKTKRCDATVTYGRRTQELHPFISFLLFFTRPAPPFSFSFPWNPKRPLETSVSLVSVVAVVSFNVATVTDRLVMLSVIKFSGVVSFWRRFVASARCLTDLKMP